VTEVKILGARELYEALSTKIPREMETKVLQRALSAGTKIVAQAARRNVVRGGSFPKRITGTLAKAIYAAKSKFDQSSTFVVRVVGVRKGKRAAKKGRDAWYGPLVEFGHRARPRKSDANLIGPAKPVPPHPFMRPAWDENKDKALQAILTALRTEIEKAAEKARFR
jgi:HK97 gp10 family phage protein